MILSTSQLKDSDFMLFWGSFRWCYWELLKPFFIKFCKDVFYISALKHFHKSFPGGHFGVFFGLFFGIYLYFLKTVRFLMKFYVYIIGNKTKKLWRGYCSLRGAILSFVFVGGGGRGLISSIFLYFLRKCWNIFIKFCKDPLGITLAITQNI